MSALFANDHWQLTALGLLIAWTLTATAAWSLAAALAFFLRRHSAQARHRVWAISMIVVLLAPLVVLLAAPLLPAHRWWRLPDATVATEAVAATSPVQLPTKVDPVAAPQAVPNTAPIRAPRLRDENRARVLVVTPSSPTRAAAAVSNVATASPRSQPDHPAFHWMFWLLVVWLIGVAVRALLFAWAMWRVHRLRAGAVELTASGESRMLTEICHQLAIRRTVRLLVSPGADVPLLCGLFIPAVILPVGHGRWPANRLRMVLVHELIHLKRRDVAWEIIAQLATLPVWFHPLALLAVRRMRVERELACDDAVLLSGATAEDYAEQLVEVAAEMRRTPALAVSAVAMAGASPIERRVRSILNPRTWRAPLGCWRTIGVSLAIIAMAFVGALLAPANGKDAPTSVAEKKQQPAEHSAGNSAEDRRVVEELDKPVSIHLANAPLEKALLALSNQCGATISFDRRTFENAGADLSPNVTIIPAQSTLREALASLSESAVVGTKIGAVVDVRRGVIHVAAAIGGKWLGYIRYVGDGQIIPIRGTVRTVEGKLAANCDVVCRTYVRTIASHTDSDGNFAVAVQKSERGNVTALLFQTDDGAQMAALADELPTDENAPPIHVTLQKPRSITVLVTDTAGKPVDEAHATVTGTEAAYDLRSYSGMTDNSGRFTARVPEKLAIGYIYAFKSGAGLDYHSYVKNRVSRDLHLKPPDQPKGTVRLVLSGARRLSVKCVDPDQKPIEGLTVAPWIFEKPGETDMLNGGGPWFARTNADGVATFDWIPLWQRQTIVFDPLAPQFEPRTRLEIDPKRVPEQPPVVVLDRLVALGGTVLDEAGKPASGAIVEISGQGYGAERTFRTAATTDADGHYLADVAPDKLYMLVAYSQDGRHASAIHDGVVVYLNKPVGGIDMALVPATRVFGQVTIGPDNKPAADRPVVISAHGRAMKIPTETQTATGQKRMYLAKPAQIHWLTTDAHGRFEHYFGPGDYQIDGTSRDDSNVRITNQKQIEFNFHVDLPAEFDTLHGTVVENGVPVPRARIAGASQPGQDFDAVADARGVFDVKIPPTPATVFARSDDGSRAGMIEIGASNRNITIPIAPVASYTIRLVHDDKKPYSGGCEITYGVKILDNPKGQFHSYQWLFGDVIQPDQNGILQLKGLAVGAKYAVVFHNSDGHSYDNITAITPKEPGEHDLGDIVFEEEKPYKPPTLDEQIASAFGGRKTAVARNDDAKAYARLADAHVLVTFADPKSPLAKQLFGLYLDGEISNTMYDEYRTVAVSIAQDKWNQAGDLGKQLGVWSWKELPLVVAEGSDGKVLGALLPSQLHGTAAGKKDSIDRATLLAFMKQYAVPRRDGKQLLQDALAQAKRENKRVIADETAVWCGPCHRLAMFLDKNRALWEKDYLWVKMDPRWPHATEIMKSLRGKADGGYPWVAILDANGTVLATSNMRDDDGRNANIGFPAEPNEIDHFVEIFKSTAQRMTPDDLAQLKKSLEAAAK